ncbi:hypothetical protein [Ureaplasma diversum]|uniref:Uncharacterized protein n=1 Tax=Ureaplasma diversum NCTC 246 TaxID=1188241 RepID=A0A084EXJ9_9BACT|nr:hypothetical protein [Ureaplasma diversum]KEZ22691.1 hypothetical protein UDIV_5290 [Ureaplasma diversum NCTC 246]
MRLPPPDKGDKSKETGDSKETVAKPSSPRRNSGSNSGHVHYNPHDYDPEKEKRDNDPIRKAKPSFADGVKEVTAKKVGDKYQFQIKFEEHAIGYNASLIFAKDNQENSEGLFSIDDISVENTDPINLEFPASEVEGKGLTKVYLKTVSYEKEDTDYIDVKLSSENLVVNLPKK